MPWPKKRAIVFGSGVTQHLFGVEIVKALCNLALLTGETEEEGGGIYPMLSQNNAQGAFDMGGFSEFLPGHVRIDEEESRNRFEGVWEKEIPLKPGLTYLNYSMGSWKAKSKPSMSSGKILSSPFPTWSVSKTDSISLNSWLFKTIRVPCRKFCPCHPSRGEFCRKEGTFTSMERRIQRVRQAIAPVGEARPDWKILCDLSTRMGYPMKYQNPAEVMEEIASLVPFYAGATYSNLEKDGIQWPLMNGKKKRFFPVRFRSRSNNRMKNILCGSSRAGFTIIMGLEQLLRGRRGWQRSIRSPV